MIANCNFTNDIHAEGKTPLSKVKELISNDTQICNYGSFCQIVFLFLEIDSAAVETIKYPSIIDNDNIF